ncbi:L-threonylcarbamoyladenylate synthase [Atopobiaceae bacterium 24-176]
MARDNGEPKTPRAPAASSEAVRHSMQGNRGKNTKPELLVRSRLREAGLTGYRLHWPVAGKPDVSWPGRRVAIMVNGCFWHRCPHCRPSMPSTHTEYWVDKFRRNVERDRRNLEILEADGWTVHVVWECQLKKKAVDATMARLLPELSRELDKPLKIDVSIGEQMAVLDPEEAPAAGKGGAAMDEKAQAHTVTTDQREPDEAVLDRAASALSAGGCVVMPTDSVYGIGAAAFVDNPGHERIFEVKGRDRAQTLPLLIAGPDELARFGADVPAWAEAVASELWPGALTLVVPAGAAVPAGFSAADGTVALRVPDSALVRGLARRAGGALAVTSANTHGAPSPASFAEIERAVIDGADLVVDGGACPVGVASTIIDAIGEEPRVLREGSVSLEDVRRAAGLA